MHTTVTDPEKAGPWGDEFEVSVTFSSNRQRILFSDAGIMSSYSCKAPILEFGTHTIAATATDAFGAKGTDQEIIDVMNTAPTATTS